MENVRTSASPTDRVDAPAVAVRTVVRRHSAAALLASLLLSFVAAPFVEELPSGDLMEAILATLVLIAAVWAVGARRRGMVAAILLSGTAAVARWITLVWPGAMPAWIPPAAYLIFVAFIVVLLIRFILGAPRVNSDVLCGAVSTYLLLGMLWATAYLLVARTNPAAFSGLAPGRPLLTFDALYFSIVTITTVGYGDIAPVSPSARMLAQTEAITGTMFVAVLVARLVSLYTVEAAVATKRDGQP